MSVPRKQLDETKLYAPFCRRSGQHVSAIFLMWRRCAQQQQRNERLASQRAHHARQDLLAGVMSLWLQYALTKQRAKAAVARCQHRHATRLLQQGFQAFQVVTEVRKARTQLVQGMLVRVQVSLCYLLCSSVVSCLIPGRPGVILGFSLN